MLHLLAKFLAFWLQPSSLAVVAIGWGLWRLYRRRRDGLRFVFAGFAALSIAGLSPLGNWLILPLEERFPVPVFNGTEPIAGIIILGGAEDGRISMARGGLGLNEAAERLTEAARLARRFPETRIVFTGGVGLIWPGGREATVPVARFFTDMGVSAERVHLESQSRNTLENAEMTRDLIAPKPGERWLLITSAFHMPRAVGVFRKAGFDVVPYPVDFRTAGGEDLVRPFAIPGGLERVDLATREWAGLLAYWLMGRSSTLFPGP